MARRPVDRRKVLTALAAAPPMAAATAAAGQVRSGWDMEVDFVSLGGGVGGLSGAVAAHEAGLQALVVEKSAKVGGVAALSLGQLWVAGNHVAAREGIQDDWKKGLDYIRWMGGGYGHEDLAETLCRNAPDVIRWFEEKARVKWIVYKDYPDYFYPMGAGSVPSGRYLEVAPIAASELGGWAAKTRKGRQATLTNEETHGANAAALSATRQQGDVRTMGAGLGAYLTRACLDRKIPLMTEAVTDELVREGDRVTGLVVRQGGRTLRIRARRGVLIAVSGYDWTPAFTHSYDVRPGSGTLTHPATTGDHLRLAGILGAQVLSISARPQWVGLNFKSGVTDEEGLPVYRSISTRNPFIIMVNRHGRRFCDESWGPSYVGALSHTDIAAPGVANQPFWAVFDAAHQRRFPMRKSATDASLPEGVLQANSLAELARLAGIDADGLVAQVAEFNRHAVKGEDPAFARGTRPQGRANGDPTHKPNPNLGPLTEAPYYAVKLEAASIGIPTAGLVGDTQARVLDWRDRPIEGLYVAGNSMAMLDLGVGYNSGLGNTRGMVFGYLAAKHAAGRA
jgi:3-oxosteroid 1-dehydrogenase